MKIEAINLSVFETTSNTSYFDLTLLEHAGRRRWRREHHSRVRDEVHVLHVRAEGGLEGVCTVGDARYTKMTGDELDQLRILTLGHSVFDRDYLFDKLDEATRGMFRRPGWFGAFDNCLWDIAGKAAKLPVYALIGRARQSCPAYYNIGGIFGRKAMDVAIRDAEKALELGYTAVKDHFQDTADNNIRLFEEVRKTVGPEVDILHDAVTAGYTFDEALKVGRALETLGFGWMEEPLPDREQRQLQRLCRALDIPILTAESLMHDITLSAQWLISGATDLLRTNARHGTTAMLKLAHLAELHGTRVEFNGPGGLFGLVHAHLVCAIRNTSYYEYFPGGTRDALGTELMGLLNPPLPQDGQIRPPDTPGWGATWDWDYFKKKRSAFL